MSQPYQQQPGPGAPGQQPYSAPPPYAQQPAGSGNTGLAVGVGIVAMIVGAVIYGAIMRASGGDAGEYTLYAYPAAAAGILVGLAFGKLGGRNPALPFVAIVLGILGAIMGQFLGYALLINHWTDGQIGIATAFTDEFDLLKEAFKEDFDALVAAMYAVGGAAGFALTKRLGSS
ncbi:hypothetical protein [Streptomyces sp. CMB-StM0423]|uniref:hypothetical protein n=1 Tax=Streptomyces sp. CMB-StM0423 TaxID=2059884 RepID=UPI000C70CC92|nr:hypothetical protein [Streptomyces sp. CMB-StM0423]AUH41082.1 hypothetical protein CXR04_13210 [Streptomyces sp. CMB-StM0423]